MTASLKDVSQSTTVTVDALCIKPSYVWAWPGSAKERLKRMDEQMKMEKQTRKEN